jgi:signal transduction histidine kinase
MLCKQFVQYHQGQIHVDSSIGDGSTFTIDIPVIPPLAHSRPTQAIVSKA